MTDKLDKYYTEFDYGSRTPVYIDPSELTDKQRERLMYSDNFCILPWVHMHAFPDGRAYPCCLSLMDHPVGNLKKQTMAEVWNDNPLKNMRKNMLSDKPSKECTKCYEREEMGFFSMRNDQNKNLGHYISEVDKTNTDGSLDEFKIRYYDIRFSNLCNLSCRSCGDIFSSNWVKESKKMGWLPKDAPNVNYAGRYEMDMWEQLEPHLDYIENVYFAGGEPLMMKEHYNLLDALIARGRTDVRLNYNTNFSKLMFKKTDVLELWKKFDRVSIGASLDANYERGELMRRGTNWQEVVDNRKRMIEIVPNVDFFISSTLSVMNAYNIVDFHKEWVEEGLIQVQDFNVNILQDPYRYRLDILPKSMKQELTKIYKDHIAWCEPNDHLSRVTGGFKGAITFMNSEDRTSFIPEFLKRTTQLDVARKENFFTIFPELQKLTEYE